MSSDVRAVPRHNSLVDHANRLKSENYAVGPERNAVTNVVNVVNTMKPAEIELDSTERLIQAHQEYIKAKVLYILSKYCGPKHTSTVAIEQFFQTIR